MEIKILGKQKYDWGSDLVWFQIDTKGREDKLMDIFVRELKLNVRNQFGWEFHTQREETQPQKEHKR